MELERLWLDAYENADADAMATMLADDFIITFPSGERSSKAQVLQDVRESRAGETRHWTENVRARRYDDTVILTGDVISESREGTGVRREVMRYTDVYVERVGRWQVVASHLSASPVR